MTLDYLLARMAGGDPTPERDGPVHARQDGRRRASTTSSAAASIATRPTPIWLVPHFEQMLYDNAQLARVYLHAWAPARHRARTATWPTGVLDYMLRELTTVDGAFAASQDADTDDVEGLTFTWTAAEIRDVLGRGRRTVHGRVRRDRPGQLGRHEHPVAGLARRAHATAVARGRGVRSLARRCAGTVVGATGVRGHSRHATTRRSPPGTASPSPRSPRRDGRSGRSATRPRPSARPRPSPAASCTTTASLGRSWKDGRATGQGVLEDYANLAEGLLALYETTFDERWFATARGAHGSRPRAVHRPGGRLLRHRR